jgi:hypothetical protein
LTDPGVDQLQTTVPSDGIYPQETLLGGVVHAVVDVLSKLTSAGLAPAAVPSACPRGSPQAETGNDVPRPPRGSRSARSSSGPLRRRSPGRLIGQIAPDWA